MRKEQQLFNQELGGRVRRLLLASEEFDQWSLAHEVNIDRSELVAYMDGVRNLNSFRLVKIAKALGVSADELLGLN